MACVSATLQYLLCILMYSQLDIDLSAGSGSQSDLFVSNIPGHILSVTVHMHGWWRTNTR
jgi:hypothetical protein